MNTFFNAPTWSTTALAVAQPHGWQALTVKLCEAGPLSGCSSPRHPLLPAQWAYFLWAGTANAEALAHGALRHRPPTEWGVASGSPLAEIRELVGAAPVQHVDPSNACVSALLRMLQDIGDVPSGLQAVLAACIAEAQARESVQRRQDPAFSRFMSRLV